MKKERIIDALQALGAIAFMVILIKLLNVLDVKKYHVFWSIFFAAMGTIACIYSSKKMKVEDERYVKFNMKIFIGGIISILGGICLMFI